MKKISEYLANQQGVLLQFILGGIMVLFAAILITVYFIAKSANPVFLDEKGRPIQTGNSARHD